LSHAATPIHSSEAVAMPSEAVAMPTEAAAMASEALAMPVREFLNVATQFLAQ